MMVAVDVASLRHIGDRPKGLMLALAVNWLVKPFTMAALGVLFFEFLFAELIAATAKRAEAEFQETNVLQPSLVGSGFLFR